MRTICGPRPINFLGVTCNQLHRSLEPAACTATARTTLCGLLLGVVVGCHTGSATGLADMPARSAGPCLTAGPVALASSPIALAFTAPLEAQAGAPITFAISATNTSDRPALLQTVLPDQTFNFLVRRADSTTVWNRLKASNIELIEDVALYQSLDPGQTVRFAAVWDQRDQTGARVTTGEYSVFGVLITGLADSLPGGCYRSEPRRLTITR